MKRKVYWKDLFASFTHSKGRFLSILTLMLLGSLALVGLKAVSYTHLTLPTNSRV